MLSYRHGFHAGGPADVLKHAVLCFVLDYVLRKPKPVYVLDTHAGAGVYSLRTEMAQKTGEWQRGVARLFDWTDPPALLQPYMRLIASVRDDLVYPGSPELARRLLRPQDRLELAELHPSDHALLADRLGGQARIRVARTDGLTLMVSRMPPPERRAVVIVDPSYELVDDNAVIEHALAKAVRAFATGIYLLWYPVIDRARTETFLAAVRARIGKPSCRLEIGTAIDRDGPGMTGSGMLVVNPPWPLQEAARRDVPVITHKLSNNGSWLVE